MKKKLLKILLLLLGIYIVLCGIIYVFQEKLIFQPEQLDKRYAFQFRQPFEELHIKATDGKLLNGLLFKTENAKGLIFYMHGNAGSLRTWGEVAKTYTDLHYDVFVLDYRSYGKSEGTITGENQLFEDNQTVYNELKKRYTEDQIVVLGYSIGTGMASKLASTNKPHLLILQAPYYSLTDLVKHEFPFIPSFVLKYKFTTNDYLKSCTMPVVIFHGNEDEVIYYNSSVKLKQEFKPQDTLITLNGQDHNGITDNEEYKRALKNILAK